MNTEGLVSKTKIAKRYGVSPRTITDWMKHRRIPFYKVNGYLTRFDPVKCDAIILQHAQDNIPLHGANENNGTIDDLKIDREESPQSN